MALNMLSNVANKVMGDVKQGTASSGDISNPGIQHEYADPSGAKMKALIWEGAGKVRVVETAKPRLVDPDDVIVKVTGSTICGSDLHLFHGAIITMEKGDILGHEYMGVVEQVGPNITKVKPGDRVVASFQIACGTCRFCVQKLSSVCERTNSSSVANAMYGKRTAGMLGYSHLTGGYAGGQAEYVRMPFGNVNLLKIPDSVPDEKALFLSDVLPTSYNCVVDTQIYGGETVGIWGMGPIGLFAAKWALLKGAKRVICIDSVQWRLDYAKERMPELELLNFSIDKDVPKKLKEMTDGNGIDVGLECAAGEYAKGMLHKVEAALGLETDTPEILNEMILAVRPFGRIGITGVYAGFVNHFNIGAVMQTGIRLIGNGQAPVHKYWEEILNDYIIPGKIDPLMMVSHRIDLSELDALYTRFDERRPEDKLMKVFVSTKFSAPPCEGGPILSNLAQGDVAATGM